MSNVKIQLNRGGVRELLRSTEMQAICTELAQGVAQRCGDGYEVSSFVGVNRANASVIATTKEAVKDNRQNNTILHALGGGSR